MRSKSFMRSMAGIAAVVAMTMAGLTTAEPASAATASRLVGLDGNAGQRAAILARDAVAVADWYFPTDAASADGVIWLQQDGTGSSSSVVRLATELAKQTNSLVVAPKFRSVTKPGGGVSAEQLTMAVAQFFVGDRLALMSSANAAGYQGSLPDKFLLVGLGKGGGFVTNAGGFTTDNGAAVNLLGVVMIDGMVKEDQFVPALSKLDTVGIPAYQIAGPNHGVADPKGGTARLLTERHPSQFVGIQMPLKNTGAVISASAGWINDIYAGNGPTDPRYGVYGNPNDGTYVPGQTFMIGRIKAKVL
jgi:hypothetical protein